MSYSTKVFISYLNHKDNITDNKRWIDDFTKHLKIVLTKLIGYQPEIISSPEKAEKITFSIIIAENRYFNSPECIKECEKLSTLSTHQYLVLLSPLNSETIPDIVASKPQYCYYSKNEISDEFQIISPENAFLYWFRLIDIAYDLYQELPQELILNKQLIKTKNEPIYLSATSEDQSINKDLLKKELQLNGYQVLPENKLPDNIEVFKKEVAKHLDDSILSIHIIGNSGVYFPGKTDSVVEIENQIASEKIKNNKKLLYRLIWMPSSLDIKDEKHLHFVEQLKRDKSLLVNAEVIQSPIEEFKNIIQKKIQDLNKPKQKKGKDLGSSGSLVYLIHEKEDTDECQSLMKVFEKNGVEATPTIYEAEEIKNIETHLEKLVKSDAVIIYYGMDNIQWLLTKLKEILKVPGYGKEDVFKAKLLITKNDLPSVNDTFLKDFEIIKQNGKIGEQELKPFLNKILSSNGR